MVEYSCFSFRRVTRAHDCVSRFSSLADGPALRTSDATFPQWEVTHFHRAQLQLACPIEPVYTADLDWSPGASRLAAIKKPLILPITHIKVTPSHKVALLSSLSAKLTTYAPLYRLTAKGEPQTAKDLQTLEVYIEKPPGSYVAHLYSLVLATEMVLILLRRQHTVYAVTHVRGYTQP